MFSSGEGPIDGLSVVLPGDKRAYPCDFLFPGTLSMPVGTIRALEKHDLTVISEVNLRGKGGSRL